MILLSVDAVHHVLEYSSRKTRIKHEHGMVLGIFPHNEVSYRWKELNYNCVTVIYNMLA